MISKGSAGADAREEKELFFRTVLFGFLVLLLTAVSGYFIFGVVTQHSGIELAAGGTYTVQITQVPERERPAMESLIESGRLKELFNFSKDELFLRQAGEDEVALCAGRYESRGSEELQEILEEVRGFEHAGGRPFLEARIKFINKR